MTPLQNGNDFSVPNSSKFAFEISNIDIQDDEIMLTFDVVLLFTAIPVKEACDYIQNKLDCDEYVHLRTNLDTTDIISLLNFDLSNNYFVYKDSIYKQIHGCAMGSPVGPVVANLCMEAIEEMAILFHPKYGNDMLTIVSASLKERQLTLSTTHSTVLINTFPLPLKKKIITRLHFRMP